MTEDTITTYRPVYVVIEAGDAPGTMRLRGSLTRPILGPHTMMVLISKGQIPSMEDVTVDLVIAPHLTLPD